jgi:hypothetical protein
MAKKDIGIITVNIPIRILEDAMYLTLLKLFLKGKTPIII